MILSLVLAIMGVQAAAPVAIEPFADVDPANALAVWNMIEAQDGAAFTAALANDAELFVDWEAVGPTVGGFAKAASECDLASDFVWASNVLGPVAPFEARLTCVGSEGHPKKLSIYFDNRDKIVGVEISEPIVVKF